jgi:hypothetical protein
VGGVKQLKRRMFNVECWMLNVEWQAALPTPIRSVLVIQHATLNSKHSTFRFQKRTSSPNPAALPTPIRSALVIQHSTLNIQHSTFGFQKRTSSRNPRK